MSKYRITKGGVEVEEFEGTTEEARVKVVEHLQNGKVTLWWWDGLGWEERETHNPPHTQGQAQ